MQKIFQKIKGFFSKNQKIVSDKSNPIPDNCYEPILSNRFIVKFPLVSKIPYWAVSNITSIKQHDNRWENITIHFLAFICPPTNEILNNFYLGYKKQPFVIEVELIDSTGVVVEKFLIEVASISEIEFGNLCYQNSAILKPSITLNVKNVIHVPVSLTCEK